MLPTNANKHSGSVALVGAGPGDPELITRKGWRLILQADVLIYDALVSDELLADIPVSIPRMYVGKRKGQHSMSQEAICELLIKQARLGKRVVRLKGGDPLVFGRVTEEIQALQQAGIAFTLVPGITAAAGCAASCNFSLTERSIAASVRFVTAHTCDDRETPWADLARRDETLVFYMGLSKAPRISLELQRHGLPPDWPVLLVERGTQRNQRSVRTDLANLVDCIQQHRLESPTLIFVGQVVAAQQINALLKAA
ncbi:uroporphyrinogen-III C-methyltransferase [Nitrincola sp.]|uniref:uroporphyrinogen-III C-methyltransferase n=1 Tax=Nitrincola sp. TaxID=1926584 RepID=UPI003A8F9282